MKPTTKIFSALVLIVAGLICLRLLTYQPLSPNDLMDAGFLDQFDDLSTTRISRFQTQGTITGIEVHVDGQINGKGIIKIGYNDSTSYRDYEIDSGTVNIKHTGDWYSNLCYLTFVPTESTSGKIKVNCNFIGD
jgi:hypothetical protein